MVRTTSTMLALGTAAPDFVLPDVVSGRTFSRDELAGPHGLLIFFICAHCPYVKHINHELVRLAEDYEGRGVGMVAICANDAVNYPDDAPEALARQARENGFLFPYLHDADQAVAKAYTAACTPDLFLFDSQLGLYYRGQLDATRPGGDRPADGHDLRRALNHLLDGHPPPENQLPSVGCNIKWKPGHEPSYFPA